MFDICKYTYKYTYKELNIKLKINNLFCIINESTDKNIILNLDNNMKYKYIYIIKYRYT